MCADKDSCSGPARKQEKAAENSEPYAQSRTLVISGLNPDVYLPRGDLPNVDRLYKNVPRLWSRDVFSDSMDTRLARNGHGDSSSFRGAA